MTSAPAAARATAIPRPMPRPALVTKMKRKIVHRTSSLSLGAQAACDSRKHAKRRLAHRQRWLNRPPQALAAEPFAHALDQPMLRLRVAVAQQAPILAEPLAMIGNRL